MGTDRDVSWRRFAQFLGAVLGALRIHFFALPAAAVLIGACSAPTPVVTPAVAFAAVAAALGWGAGQLLNDLLDVEADAIDAPGRAGPRGLLPVWPTLALIGVMALGITAVTVAVHPQAFWLAIIAAGLLLGYGPAKRWPVAGNIAHGALITTATVIGSAAASPSLPLSTVVARSLNLALLSGTWSALYLQANYEKDRRGDTAAGVLTLAHVLGLRQSALLRSIAAAAWIAWVAVTAPLSNRPLLLLSLVLVIVSSGYTALGNSETAALKGYRFAVHAAVVGLSALAAPALGSPMLVAFISVASILIELAFWRSPNP